MRRRFALLLFTATIAASAFAQLKTDSWDAGRVDRYDPAKNNGLHRGSLQVVNRCCKGEHQFQIGTVAPWIVIHPNDASFTLPDGGLRTVYLGLDARVLRLGTHEAKVNVRCVTCEGDLCSYSVNIKLAVVQQVTTGVYTQSQTRTPRVECPDPPLRVKAGATARHCTFTGSYGPKIQLTPCAENARGGYAGEEMKTLLGDMASAISAATALKSAFDASGTLRQPELPSGTDAAAGLTTAFGGKATKKATGTEIDIPTSAAEVPTALASNYLNAGQKMADWAVRAGDREGRMCIVMAVEAEEVELKYDCLPFEKCEQGVWSDAGPQSIPDKLPQPFPVVKTHRRPFPEFNIINNNMSEYQQRVGQMQTWLSQIGIAEKMRRMQIFETLGPCHACDPPPGPSVGGTPPPTTGGGGRSCAHILLDITLTENEIFDLQAATDELRRQLQEMPGRLQKQANRCQQESNKLEAELDQARVGVRGARNEAFDAAVAKREAADRAFTAQTQRCNQEREQLEREQQRLQRTISESEATIAQLQAALAALRQEYKECLGQ